MIMDKVAVFFSFVVLVLVVAIAKLYVTPIGFEEPAYPQYREEYAHNLRDPLLDKYRSMAIELPCENDEALKEEQGEMRLSVRQGF